MIKKKTVGILGGMGPYATLSFYQMILDLTPATKDWDHLRVIIDVNPLIPSRSRYHLFGESSPVPAMIESCRRLEAYPVDFIVIPCNSAAYFLPQVQACVHVPLLNIMQVTVASLPQQLPGVHRMAVIGGVITYDHRTYEKLLEDHGIEYVHHSADIQRRVEHLIELIKINKTNKDIENDFQNLIYTLHNNYKVDAVILGCTEFACLGTMKTAVPIVDSSRELARAVIQLASTSTTI